MSYTPPLNGGRINATISGNTAGAGALVSSGTMVMAGGNNITLSQNANSITISGAAAVAQTNQTVGLYALGNTTQNSSSTRDARSLSFNGIGGITVGYSNGSIQLSGPQTAAQTNQTVGLYALGNTTQNSSTTRDARSLSFNGIGAATVGYSNGSIQFSVPTQTVQTQSNIQAVYDGANSISTGTLRFSNSNGIGFGINGQTLTASHNGITSQTNQNVSLYALGNTTQNSSTLLNASNMSFNGLGNATVGFSNGSIQISGGGGAGGGIAAYDGANSVTSGTLRFSNSNGVSFGINGQTITASVNAGGVAMVDGAATISSGSASFADGNGVSFGINGQTVTASVAAQTNQTGNLYAVGNTTQNSSTNYDARTLSFNGLGGASVGYSNGSVQISVPNTGFTGTHTLGASNLGNTSGTSGVITGPALQMVLAGGDNITLSQSINASSATITISAADAGAAPVVSYYDNLIQQASVQALTYTSVSTGMFGRVIVQPLDPSSDFFPGDMTVSTMLLNYSNSGSSNISAAHTSSMYVGLYTRVNSTQLSLANSVSTSWSMNANNGNSASYLGARYLSFHSSQFSSEPVMSVNKRYFFGILARSGGASYASLSMAGMHYGQSVQRSGFLATAVSSGTSVNAWHPFMGIHSLTTHVALPVSLANSDINKASVYANFIPHVILNAGGGLIN